METFLAVVTQRRAIYYRNADFAIYRIKDNRPVFLGETRINTGSMKGYDSEVLTWLFHNEHVSEKHYNLDYGYYSPSKHNENGLRIDIIQT
jgi:hypothetical protein